MQNRLLFATILAATPILALSPAAFPAGDDPGCVRATVGGRQNQRELMSLMRRRNDAADRALSAYAVPRVKSREVKQVNDPELCERAAIAYGKVVQDESIDRRVHIVHVGGRFVVVDPEYAPDRRQLAVTFDSTFSRPLAVVPK